MGREMQGVSIHGLHKCVNFCLAFVNIEIINLLRLLDVFHVLEADGRRTPCVPLQGSPKERHEGTRRRLNRADSDCHGGTQNGTAVLQPFRITSLGRGPDPSSYLFSHRLLRTPFPTLSHTLWRCVKKLWVWPPAFKWAHGHI